MDVYFYWVLAVPLLILDWQLALIWVIGVIEPNVVSILSAMDFQGMEVYFIFLAVGSVRRLIFRRST